MTSENLNWSNEKVLEFLELYQTESVLWNPINKNHKNRNKVFDAWFRLSNSLDIPVNDLKKKKESLMATYRMYKKKCKESVRSGASADEVYKCNWFAFDVKDNFLGAVYDKNKNVTINTEDLEFSNEIENECQNEPITNQRRNREEINVKDHMDEAVNLLKNMSEKSNREVDDVDLFCQLLAKKIKKFADDNDRENIMRDIDNLMFNWRNKGINEHIPPNTRCSTATSFYDSASCSSSLPEEGIFASYLGNAVSGSSVNKPIKILSNKILQKAYMLSQNE